MMGVISTAKSYLQYKQNANLLLPVILAPTTTVIGGA